MNIEALIATYFCASYWYNWRNMDKMHSGRIQAPEIWVMSSVIISIRANNTNCFEYWNIFRFHMIKHIPCSSHWIPIISLNKAQWAIDIYCHQKNMLFHTNIFLLIEFIDQINFSWCGFEINYDLRSKSQSLWWDSMANRFRPNGSFFQQLFIRPKN